MWSHRRSPTVLPVQSAWVTWAPLVLPSLLHRTTLAAWEALLWAPPTSSRRSQYLQISTWPTLRWTMRHWQPSVWSILSSGVSGILGLCCPVWKMLFMRGAKYLAWAVPLSTQVCLIYICSDAFVLQQTFIHSSFNEASWTQLLVAERFVIMEGRTQWQSAGLMIERLWVWSPVGTEENDFPRVNILCWVFVR